MRGGQRAHQHGQAVEIVGRQLGDFEAEEVLELQRADDQGNTGGEAGGHRVGHELDEAAHAREPIAIRIIPAIIVASSRPPRPKRVAIGARMTTKAAVGPRPGPWIRRAGR
jgi:hypothetical protein